MSFSILSLNAFGVPFYLSSGRIRRLSAELNRFSPSMICLQEIQQNAYLPLLQKGLSAYSQQAFFRNRYAPKGGLFTAAISSCPIINYQFYPYPNQGRPLSIGFSDWALNKGLLVVKLEVHERPFVVINTHLQANYLGDWKLSNNQTKIQLDQVSYLVELIHAQPRNAWVLVCGDFNFPRQAPAYQQMLSQSGLVDPLLGDPRPTYSPFPFVPSMWHTSLDYFFYQIPNGVTCEVTADIIPVKDSTAKLPFQRFLTDHHALILTFHIQ
jgi:endonuclease/exonuclease/phosphatase family metal-dependent hydrolase